MPLGAKSFMQHDLPKPEVKSRLAGHHHQLMGNMLLYGEPIRPVEAVCRSKNHDVRTVFTQWSAYSKGLDTLAN